MKMFLKKESTKTFTLTNLISVFESLVTQKVMVKKKNYEVEEANEKKHPNQKLSETEILLQVVQWNDKSCHIIIDYLIFYLKIKLEKCKCC